MSEPPNSTNKPDLKPETTKINPDVSKPIENVTTEVKKDARKAFEHPVLKMMGIPKIRIPSRNWLIFWTLLGGFSSAIAYDKYQQKQISKKWMNYVEDYSKKPFDPLTSARKVTIYMAPPPGDYLTEADQFFRKFIKPILVAGAVDYEVRSEKRQGEIRTVVAHEVRELRSNPPPSVNDSKATEVHARTSSPFGTPVTDEVDQVIFSMVKPETGTLPGGGVICIGRGSYKEYLAGLHEGLLGPLERPVREDESETSTDEGKKSIDKTEKAIEEPKVESLGEIVSKNEGDNTNANEEKKEETKNEEEAKDELDEDGNKKKKLKPVPTPYIFPNEYESAKFAPELPPVPSSNEISNYDTLTDYPNYKFLQPVSVFRHPSLVGFLNTPIRIYRFLTKRYVAEEMGRQAAAVVVGNTRPFNTTEDVQLAATDELDWPKKWRKEGIKKDSEWMKPLVTDSRILNKLWVYSEEGIDGEKPITSVNEN